MKQKLLTVAGALVGAFLGAIFGAYVGEHAMDIALGGSFYLGPLCTMVLGFVGGAILGAIVGGPIGVGYIRPPQCEQPMPRKGLE